MELSEMESQDELGESDAIVEASLLGGFSEIDETKAIISSLPEVHGDSLTRERITERFRGETVICGVHHLGVNHLMGDFRLFSVLYNLPISLRSNND